MRAASRRDHGLHVVLGIAVAWGGLGLALNLVFPPDEWQATFGVLMMTQAFCMTPAWLRFRAAATGLFPDFLTIFLLFQLINKTLMALNLLAPAIGFEIETIDSLANVYRWQAELVFFAGTVLFTLGWFFLERRRSMVVCREPSPEALWWIYGLSMALYLVIDASGVSRVVGMAFALFRLFAIGALGVLLGGQSRYALGRNRSWLSLLALIPLYILALRSGSKGEIIIVSLTVLFPIIRRLTVPRLSFLSGFLLFVVLFIFPFSNELRKANWESWGGSEDAGIAEVSSRVLSRWGSDGLVTTAVESSAQWLARTSSSDAGGLVMEIADQDGHIGGVLIEGLMYIFVPRVIWPEKPSFAPGAWFTWYLGNALSPETATSATAAMLGTEMYWMYGAWGVLIGMGLLGVLYARCWSLMIEMSEWGPVPLVALFAFLVEATVLESTNTLYAISGPIILVVYVYLLHRFQRWTWPRLSRWAANGQEIGEIPG